MAPQSYSAKRLPKAAPESCYWKLLPEVVCVQPYNIGINSNNKLRTCRYTLRLALLGRNSEQPCGLRQGHRHRINMTKCVAIWKYTTGLVVQLHSAGIASLFQRPFQCKVSGTKKTLVPTTSRLEISVGMTFWCLLCQAMLYYTRQNLICMLQIL